MQPLEPVAGECRMAWSVFADLPAVRAAAPTAADLRALRIHLQRSGLLTKDGMVNAAGSPLASWQRDELAAAIPPRLTARPRRKRSGNYAAGTGQTYRPWNPLNGSYY